DGLANGVRIITRAIGGRQADDAAAIARCALAIRAVLPAAAMAITMGRSAAGAAARAEASDSFIERGAELLDIAEASRTSGEEPVIRVDDVAGGVLASRFELRRDAH